MAYFFLGNSYDQQYKPSKKGDPANDALLTKAAQNYQTAAEKLSASEKPDDKKLSQAVAAVSGGGLRAGQAERPGEGRAGRPADDSARPVGDDNYFALAKIYEDAGAYDDAEQMLLKAKDAKPNDPAVYSQLAGYYNRQGQFEKTIEALEQRATKEPNNPEAFYTIATYYWDEAYRDARLKPDQKKDYVQKGLAATDQALQIKPDYMDALVYKGLLLRLQANLEKDPKKQAT